MARHGQQVLAGIGFTTEHPLHHYVRRALVLDHLLGDSRSLTASLGADLLRPGAAVVAAPVAGERVAARLKPAIAAIPGASRTEQRTEAVPCRGQAGDPRRAREVLGHQLLGFDGRVLGHQDVGVLVAEQGKELR